ncbi:uncharacterized protein EI90DRAFT_3236176, partial [Cantharellus anzutake]|uniref:uncharacterized protein n=1 Tax=Cantharellus anzutake TaxID=1750568 RepID=UPI001908D476
DQVLLQCIAYKVKHNLSLEGWNELPYTFPGSANADISTLKTPYLAFARLQELSGMKFDCCHNSCICYAGDYASQQSCHHCGESQYLTSCPFDDSAADRSHPQAEATTRHAACQFSYLPIIPHLRTLFKSMKMAQAMRYHSQYFKTSSSSNGYHEEGKVRDVFDGERYRRLLNTSIVLQGKDTGGKFFDGKRDVALGLSTDSFCPFKKKK